MKKKTKKIIEKRPPHRPSKVVPFIEAANKVLFDDINVIIHTDEELVAAVNELLPEKDKVSYLTFKEWKAGNVKSALIEDFASLLKKALRQQKASLFFEMRKDTRSWPKWAWILERKFKEWNIRDTSSEPVKDSPQLLIDWRINTNGEGNTSIS